MSVSETVALLPQTLHYGMPSRTLCIPSQTTTHNKETSSCIQHSKALHYSGRPYTRIRTATAPPPPPLIFDKKKKEREEILGGYWTRRGV